MTRCPYPHRSRVVRASLAIAVSALCSSAFPLVATAQDPAPGSLDPNFDITRARGTGYIPVQTDFTPFAIALQPGQDPVIAASPNLREIPAAQTKLLIGGDAATLTRSFLTTTVRASTVYADGTDVTIPAGTLITTYTAPFLPGDPDTVFLTAPGVSNGFGGNTRTIYSLSVGLDGGVLVGGLFGPSLSTTSVFRNQQKNFILLNFDGDTEISLDASNVASQGLFNANVGTGANNSVLAILRRTTVVPGEPDGRIVLGGQFINFNAVPRGRVAQLLPDGSSDAAFNTNLGSGANGIVFSLAEAVGPGLDASGLPFFGVNGQVYVCGDFNQFNGKGPGKLVRLNADGTLDTSFAPTIVGRAIAVAVQPDGGVLLGGDLDSVNGTAVNNVARLNPDGSLDPVFLANATVSLSFPNNIPPTAVYVLKVQPDGRILVGGNYLLLDKQTRNYLGRLNADGTLDTSFDADALLPDPTNSNTNVTTVISNAIQGIATVPRDPSLGNGLDVIYSQTRADRKQVSGDTGFFPNPVRRLFGDTLLSGAASQFGGSPLIGIGADGPTATVGDLTPRPELAGQVVLNPGTPGLFRITRSGDTSSALTVHLKVLSPSDQLLGSTYNLRQFLFTPTTTTVGTTTTTTIVTTTSVPLAPKFDVDIPAGSNSVSIIVEGIPNGLHEDNQPVTIKLRGPGTSAPYGKQPGLKSATVTILANNL